MDICQNCCVQRKVDLSSEGATGAISTGRCGLCGKDAVVFGITPDAILCLPGDEEKSAAPSPAEMVAMLRADFEDTPDWTAGELLTKYVNHHIAAALGIVQQYVDRKVEKAIEAHEDDGAMHEGGW